MKETLYAAPAVVPKAQSTRLPRLEFTDGTIEAVKWLAAVLMLLDHVNKYVLHDSMPALFAAGRLSMPLFSFALAFNMARPGAMSGGAGLRVLKRLGVVGLISSVPFIALGGLGWGWWPFNVMAMLAVTVAVMQLVESNHTGRLTLTVIVFVLGGAFVEFWWAGVVVGLAAWRYCRRPSWSALALWALGLAALFIINRNWWAMASLPLVFAASRIKVPMPRARWFFYAFYPAHLALLWLLVRFG